jgi:hypothetical protein
MFRLVGVMLRPSTELIQDYLITSALGGVTVMWNYLENQGIIPHSINTTYCKRYGIPEYTSY